jgi:hypothetical protein
VASRRLPLVDTFCGTVSRTSVAGALRQICAHAGMRSAANPRPCACQHAETHSSTLALSRRHARRRPGRAPTEQHLRGQSVLEGAPERTRSRERASFRREAATFHTVANWQRRRRASRGLSDGGASGPDSLRRLSALRERPARACGTHCPDMGPSGGSRAVGVRTARTAQRHRVGRCSATRTRCGSARRTRDVRIGLRFPRSRPHRRGHAR